MKIFLLTLVLTACPLFGDGGSVIARQESGPFTVTLFAAPADWSVLVQRTDSLSAVLDAQVSLVLRSGDTELRFAGTHAQAQNKLLYAAPVVLPHAGNWNFVVQVDNSPALNGVFAAPTPVPDALEYWPYFALPVIAILLFLLRQMLAARTMPRQTTTNQSPKRAYTVLSSR